jgi:hypothetical protein
MWANHGLVWAVVNGLLLVLTVALILSVYPEPNGWLTFGLASLFLITSRTPLALGQPAAFSISLVVIGSVLFLRGRYLPLGTLLFILSLAVKPQVGGLIVLYFLVWRIHWQHAAGACGGALALLLVAGLILKAHPASANWFSDLRANAAASVSPGAINDPRPANPASTGDVNLQAFTSIFFPGATAFNAASWAIFLVLLAAWTMFVLHESDSGSASHYAALGALAIISLMPVYHRFYDTRLLLIAIPALPAIDRNSRALAGSIAAFTIPAIICFPYRAELFFERRGDWQNIVQHKFVFALLMRNQILALLLLFFLYLSSILAVRANAPGREFTAEQIWESTQHACKSWWSG